MPMADLINSIRKRPHSFHLDFLSILTEQQQKDIFVDNLNDGSSILDYNFWSCLLPH